MGSVIDFPTPKRPDPKKHSRAKMALLGLAGIFVSLVNWAATLFGFVVGIVVMLLYATWAFIRIFYIFIESTIMIVVMVVILALLI